MKRVQSFKQPLSAFGRLNAAVVNLIICAFLVLITWAVFAQTLGHEFINYDDYAYVVDNPQVATGITLSGVRWAFTHSHSYNWHPLTTLSHMMDCQLYGLRPAGHHGTNVFLHSLSVVLLFLVLREMTTSSWRSAFVAALFAVHPLHVESVAWVAERKDVLSGVFFMLTLGAYLRYVRKPSLTRYGIVCLIFALGLLSKPMLVTLPVVLLLLDYWPLGRFHAGRSTSDSTSLHWLKRLSISRRLMVEKLPLLLLSGVSALVTVLAQGRSVSSVASIPVWVRLYQASVSSIVYIYQMLWPVKLGVFYPYPRGALSIFPPLVAVVVLSVATAIVIRLRKQRPYLFTGWFWYLVMLTPVIGLVQVGMQSRADRYTYLPQVGLYLAITWAVADWPVRWRHSREIVATVGATIVIVLACCGWIQAGYWKNSESLWRHTLAVTGDNAVAHNDLGNALERKGRFSEAMLHFKKAVELWPNYSDGYYNLGASLFRAGRLDEAISCWQRTIAIRRDDADAHANLGRALSLKRHPSEAVAEYDKSLRIAPASREVMNDLAWLLSTCDDANVRNGARAIALARQADQLGGGKDPTVVRTLAAAYAENGMFNDAIQAAQRALSLAESRKNPTLAGQIRLDIDLYRLNLPHR